MPTSNTTKGTKIKQPPPSELLTRTQVFGGNFGTSAYAFCWGVYLGREWVIHGCGPSVVIRCDGASAHRHAASKAKDCDNFPCWQVLTVPGAEQLPVCSLAWCGTPPAPHHPRNARPYIASAAGLFAVGLVGKVAIFAPSHDNKKSGFSPTECFENNQLLSWQCMTTLDVAASPLSSVTCLSWSPDARFLLSGSDSLCLWAITPNKREKKREQWAKVKTQWQFPDPQELAFQQQQQQRDTGGPRKFPDTPTRSANKPRNDQEQQHSILSPTPTPWRSRSASSGLSGVADSQLADASSLSPVSSETSGSIPTTTPPNTPGLGDSADDAGFNNNRRNQSRSTGTSAAVGIGAENVLPGQCALVEFSPDGRLFASVHEMSKVARVWYSSPGVGSDMSCILLDHGRGLMGLQWRPRAGKPRRRRRFDNTLVHIPSSQTLLTISCDGAVRIWQESSYTEDFGFVPIRELSKHTPSSSPSLSPSNCNSPCFTISASWVQPVSAYRGLRWTDDSRTYPEPSQRRTARSKLGLMHGGHGHYTAADMQQEVDMRIGPFPDLAVSRDWLVILLSTGSVELWELESLSTVPRGAVHVNLHRRCESMSERVGGKVLLDLLTDLNGLAVSRSSSSLLGQTADGEPSKNVLPPLPLSLPRLVAVQPCEQGVDLQMVYTSRFGNRPASTDVVPTDLSLLCAGIGGAGLWHMYCNVREKQASGPFLVNPIGSSSRSDKGKQVTSANKKKSERKSSSEELGFVHDIRPVIAGHSTAVRLVCSSDDCELDVWETSNLSKREGAVLTVSDNGAMRLWRVNRGRIFAGGVIPMYIGAKYAFDHISETANPAVAVLVCDDQPVVLVGCPSAAGGSDLWALSREKNKETGVLAWRANNLTESMIFSATNASGKVAVTDSNQIRCDLLCVTAVADDAQAVSATNDTTRCTREFTIVLGNRGQGFTTASLTVQTVKDNKVGLTFTLRLLQEHVACAGLIALDAPRGCVSLSDELVVVVAGSRDGTIGVWGVGIEAPLRTFRCIGNRSEKDAASDMLVSISTSWSGRIATLWASGVVCVWESESDNPLFVLEKTLPILAVSVELCALGARTEVAALVCQGASPRLHVFALVNENLVSVNGDWVEICKSDEWVATPSIPPSQDQQGSYVKPGSPVCWTREGGVVVGMGVDGLACMTGWTRHPPQADLASELQFLRRKRALFQQRKGSDASMLPLRDVETQLESTGHIGALAANKQRPLPDYHPHFLMECLYAGLVAEVRAILHHLWVHVKAHSDRLFQEFGAEHDIRDGHNDTHTSNRKGKGKGKGGVPKERKRLHLPPVPLEKILLNRATEREPFPVRPQQNSAQISSASGLFDDDDHDFMSSLGEGGEATPSYTQRSSGAAGMFGGGDDDDDDHHHDVDFMAMAAAPPAVKTTSAAAGMFDLDDEDEDDDLDFLALDAPKLFKPARSGAAASALFETSGSDDDENYTAQKSDDVTSADDVTIPSHDSPYSEHGRVNKEISQLSSLLPSVSLDDLSPSDSLQLLAVVSIFEAMHGEGSQDREALQAGARLDVDGTQFLIAHKAFEVRRRTLQASQYPASLTTAQVAWAVHSTQQEDLVSICMATATTPTWAEVRMRGVGLWLRSAAVARALAEKIAQAEYRRSEPRDPFACASIYFALGKKTVVQALFRACKTHSSTKVVELLACDFTQEVHKRVAVKNAFALLQKHRFRDAVSFFLLAGQVGEAANVCVRNLQDYQLGMFLALLAQGEASPVRRRLLSESVLPLATLANDKWLGSIVHTLLGNPHDAIMAFTRDVKDSITGSMTKVRVVESHENLRESSQPTLTTVFNSSEPLFIQRRLRDPKLRRAIDPLTLSQASIFKSSLLTASSFLMNSGLPLLALECLEDLWNLGVLEHIPTNERPTNQWRSNMVRDLAAEAAEAALLHARSTLLVCRNRPEALSNGGYTDEASDTAIVEHELKALSDNLNSFPESIRVFNGLVHLCACAHLSAAHLMLIHPAVTLARSVPRGKALADETPTEPSDISTQTSAQLSAVEEDDVSKYERATLLFTDHLNDIMDALGQVGHSMAREQLNGGVDGDLPSSRRCAAMAVVIDDAIHSLHFQQSAHTRSMIKKMKSRSSSTASSVSRAASSGDMSTGGAQPTQGQVNYQSSQEGGENEALWQRASAAAYFAMLVAAVQMDQVAILRRLVDFEPAATHASLAKHGGSEEQTNVPSRHGDLHRGVLSAELRAAALRLSFERFDHEELLIQRRFAVDNADDVNSSSDSPGNPVHVWRQVYGRRVWRLLVVRHVVSKIEQMGGGLVPGLLEGATAWCDTLLADLQSCAPPPPRLVLPSQSTKQTTHMNGTNANTEGRGNVDVVYGAAQATPLGQLMHDAFENNDEQYLWEKLEGRGFLRVLFAEVSMADQALMPRLDGIVPEFRASDSIEMYRKSGQLLLSCCVVGARPEYIQVASEMGIREINVSSSIRFRQRSASPSRRTLLDEECHTWEATYNRFKHFETIHGGGGGGGGTTNSINTNSFFPSDRPTVAPLVAASKGQGQHHPGSIKQMLGRGTPHTNGTTANGVGGPTDFFTSLTSSAAATVSSSTLSATAVLNRGAQYRAAAGEEQSEIVSALSTWNMFAPTSRFNGSLNGSIVGSPANTQQRSFLGHPQRRLAQQVRELTGPKRRVDHNSSALRLAPHPFLPHYFAGAPDGSVVLWEVGCVKPLVSYCKPAHAGWRNGHISRVRVSMDGHKMAACDSSGQLALWRVCGGDKEIFPFVGLKCNSKRTLDCEFLNDGTVLATVGQSATHRNLCIWDTLMPPRVCRVAAINCGPSNGLYSMTYSDRYQQIVVGDGSGNLSVYDLRQRRVSDTVMNAHGKAVMVLTRDPVGHFVASGSTDGSVKVWSLASSRLEEVCVLPNIHPQHTFVNQITSDSMISQRGVTDLAWTEQSLITCGADGTVKLTPRNKFKVWQ